MPDHDIIIIGGGISGLSALHFIKTKNPELSVLLIEKESRLGGTIGTDSVDGYSFDWGPNGFLDREPLTLRLAKELGLKDKLEPANINAENRYILRKGRLRTVPMKPPKFVTSDILSLKGKLRVFCEPFGRKAPEGDESIYDFVLRRIGREAADYLVQPMVSGVYGGVASKLSLKSCFPIMSEMEAEHGSLFKAMIAKAKKAKREGKKSGGPSGPGGWLTSFDKGLYTIIERFNELYGQYVRSGDGVAEMAYGDNEYSITTESGECKTAKNIILASPSYVSSNLAKSISEELSESLGEIKYAPISVICMGFDKNDITCDLNGFGFLVPKKENKRILGSIWTSSIFKDRAPEGKVQFRSMIGGDGDHGSLNLSDEEMTEIVTGDLNSIIGVKKPPEVVRIYRWKNGIPQYHVGHSEKMSRIESELEKFTGLFIAGNAYYGIGLNDCVKQSFKISEIICNQTS